MTVGSVSPSVAELQGGFQMVHLVALHAAVPLGGLQILVPVVQLPYLKNFWDVIRQWCQVLCMPQNSCNAFTLCFSWAGTE